MLQQLLKPEIQEFIHTHLKKSPAELMLQRSKYPDWPMREIVEQIQAFQKAKKKLPREFLQKDIILNPLSVEQASSYDTALYKSKLIQGHTLLDLTGGLGIDSYFFAKSFTKVIHNEISPELSKLVQNNFKQLKVDNISFARQDAELFLNTSDPVDAIYIDPARRDEQDHKVYQLSDCTPNILKLMPQMLQNAPQILIKLSPMLDIEQGLLELLVSGAQVHKIWVIAFHNEVKELLYLCKAEKAKQTDIIAINLGNKGTQEFSFTKPQEEQTEVAFKLPKEGEFLIEPSRALLKAGAFKSFSKYFNLYKLHPNSHLYITNHLSKKITGIARTFQVEAISKYSKKEVKKIITNKKANIKTRNFPDSVEQIRKKLNIKEGGDQYIFATTDIEEKLILIFCKKYKV